MNTNNCDSRLNDDKGGKNPTISYPEIILCYIGNVLQINFGSRFPLGIQFCSFMFIYLGNFCKTISRIMLKDFIGQIQGANYPISDTLCEDLAL